MSEHVFYARGKSRGNQRKITLVNAALITPTTNKRIKMKVNMGLSTQKTAGQPEWIAAAHDFVAKNGDPVSPTVTFKGFEIGFATNNQNLFNDGTLSQAACEMKSFEVHEQGPGDEKDIVMTFLVYAPFSSALWEYAGQYAGDEIWAKFDQRENPEEEAQEDLELEGEDAEEEDSSEDEEESEDE